MKELIESDKDSHGMHAGFVVHSKNLFLLCRDFFYLCICHNSRVCVCVRLPEWMGCSVGDRPCENLC